MKIFVQCGNGKVTRHWAKGGWHSGVVGWQAASTVARFSFDIPAENRMSFRGNLAAVSLKQSTKIMRRREKC